MTTLIPLSVGLLVPQRRTISAFVRRAVPDVRPVFSSLAVVLLLAESTNQAVCSAVSAATPVIRRTQKRAPLLDAMTVTPSVVRPVLDSRVKYAQKDGVEAPGTPQNARAPIGRPVTESAVRAAALAT